MSYPFKIKNTYSFDVYPATILGSAFQNVTILGILDYQSALSLADIDSLHVNVFPFLPAGLDDNPDATEYLKIRTSSGIETVLGLNWIREETIVEVQSLKGVFIVDGINSMDVAKIILAIQQNGYNNVSGKIQ